MPVVADLLRIDTSVLIDQERGVPEATNCVASLLRSGGAAMHPVSRAECLAGARDRRHIAAIKFGHSGLRMLAVRNEDFARALDVLEACVLSTRVEWPDCLIAATCLRLGIPIVTVNDRACRAIKGLRVVRPY